jgi:hypothetical protein
MSFKRHWVRYGKCVAGVLGGAGLGLVTGESIGNAAFVALLGTLGCGILGGVSGLFAGAATSCGGK